MTAIQVYLSVAAGKRLIAKALAANEEVQEAMKEHTVLVVKGTSNAYLAEELLKTLNGSLFDKKGFFRGVVKPASVPLSGKPNEYDLVIRKGEVLADKTIFDVAGEMGAGDIAFKGANAVNLTTGRCGILIGNTTVGTIGPLMQAAVGRRMLLIHPVGVEKRVDADINDLADLCNDDETTGLRMYPTTGYAYTELDAFRDLFGVEATLIASGGVGGYEGGCYFHLEGHEETLAECRKGLEDIINETPYEL
ncbi:MAG: hypothetical protein IJ120_10325 [Solobacterium sp.]|nr:hypothetical protein [Solobacterium sp.]